MNRPDLLSLSESDLTRAANPGLVKRARRELEDPNLSANIDVSDSDVVLRWSDGIECRFPPASSLQGQCSCAAIGICRHLVRSVLYLQSQAPTELSDEEPSPKPSKSRKKAASKSRVGIVEELRKASEKELVSAVGRPALTNARKQLAGGWEGSIDRDQQLVRFDKLGVTVHFPPKSALASAVCDCRETPPCSHIIPALLLLRGETQPSAPIATSDRSEIAHALERARSLTNELVQVGLDGLSSEWRHASRTTALEIRKAGLEIPADLLERLAESVESMRLGTGKGSADALRWQLAAVFARLLANPDASTNGDSGDLVKRPPRCFWTGGARKFHAVGCQGWTTTKVNGLTIYFQDVSTGEVVTSGTARPLDRETSSSQLAQVASILGPFTTRDLLGHVIDIPSTRLSPEGRLRIPTDVTATISTEPIDWRSVLSTCGVTRWSDLAHRLREFYPMLITLRRSLVHWLSPVEWGNPELVSAGQELSWPMYDPTGRKLSISYRYTAERNASFRALRTLAEHVERPIAWLGRLRAAGSQMAVEPLTLLHETDSGIRPYYVDIDKAPRERKKLG